MFSSTRLKIFQNLKTNSFCTIDKPSHRIDFLSTKYDLYIDAMKLPT